MEDADIEKYAVIMQEIKLRSEVINLFLSGQREARYFTTTVELPVCNFGKFRIDRLCIACGKSRQYSLAYANFSKHWEAAKLLKNLKRINPNFFSKTSFRNQSDCPESQMI